MENLGLKSRVREVKFIKWIKEWMQSAEERDNELEDQFEKIQRLREWTWSRYLTSSEFRNYHLVAM